MDNNYKLDEIKIQYDESYLTSIKRLLIPKFVKGRKVDIDWDQFTHGLSFPFGFVNKDSGVDTYLTESYTQGDTTIYVVSFWVGNNRLGSHTFNYNIIKNG